MQMQQKRNTRSRRKMLPLGVGDVLCHATVGVSRRTQSLVYFVLLLSESELSAEREREMRGVGGGRVAINTEVGIVPRTLCLLRLFTQLARI